jgi:Mn-dependent DtxR family transcriptional regulator
MRAQRFAFLHAVFEAADGGENRMVRVLDIAESLDFDGETIDRAIDYLVGEGLLAWAAMGMVELTHLGVKEIEDALEHPERPTEHFPASVVNYINVESMIG